MADVDLEPIIAVVHTRHAPSVIPEFMAYNDAAFGDEQTEGSNGDHLVPELSDSKKVVLQRTLAEHAADVPDCRDFSRAHRVVADGF
jgi:hypothetical protein